MALNQVCNMNQTLPSPSMPSYLAPGRPARSQRRGRPPRPTCLQGDESEQQVRGTHLDADTAASNQEARGRA